MGDTWTHSGLKTRLNTSIALECPWEGGLKPNLNEFFGGFQIPPFFNLPHDYFWVRIPFLLFSDQSPVLFDQIPSFRVSYHRPRASGN